MHAPSQTPLEGEAEDAHLGRLGYPAGWVTALGLPRTAQLRLLGNSVQPHVAEAAARLLLAPLLVEAAA